LAFNHNEYSVITSGDLLGWSTAVKEFEIATPGGRIQMSPTDVSIGQRYITLDSQPVFMTGNHCGSCGFFFQRVGGEGVGLSSSEISSRLNSGLDGIDEEIIDATRPLLPTGRYTPTMYTITPRLTELGAPDDYYTGERTVMWGDPSAFWQGVEGGPKTAYYRARTIPFDDNKALYEFIVPFGSFDDLDAQRVDAFESDIRGGSRPTALALTLLSVQALSPWWEYDETPWLAPDIEEHWCVTHYLIDGHHKTLAASRVGLPLSLLSLMTDEGYRSKREDIERALKLLA
jgi:hypothetical protein